MSFKTTSLYIMLKRNHKFKRVDFNTFFTSRKPIHSTNFIIRYEKVKSWDQFKTAFVVSKKVEKSAVERNKTKRRLYYATLNIQKNITTPFKAIVIVKKSIKKVTSQALQQELLQTLK